MSTNSCWGRSWPSSTHDCCCSRHSRDPSKFYGRRHMGSQGQLSHLCQHGQCSQHVLPARDTSHTRLQHIICFGLFVWASGRKITHVSQLNSPSTWDLQASSLPTLALTQPGHHGTLQWRPSHMVRPQCAQRPLHMAPWPHYFGQPSLPVVWKHNCDCCLSQA